ncbi:MAG TPA: hypothetical protein VFO19_15505 [Vicinamibacterales bacterium]|nr:hypothetical protein [Vicinamibacterales bacterium]
MTVRVRPLLPAGRIAVSVVPPAHGWASPSAVVWLEYSDGFRAREVTGRDLAAATGAFEFDDLPPGRYAIVANNAPIIGRPGGTALPGGWATETVDVSPDGTTQSTLQLDRAVAISGRLAFDPLSSRTDLSTIGVSLVPISLPPPLARRLPGNVLDQTDFSGRFAVRNIPAGRYAIRIETAEGNWTATSVRLFGREVVDEPIEISTDLAAIEVTLFDRRSDLRGTVGTEDAAAQTARAVALFAKETRYWWPGSPRIRLAPIALGGTFEVDDLGPGTYLIAAGDFDPGEPWTEALLTSLRPLAAEIAIGRGERLIVDLQVRAGRTTASVKVPSGR